MENEFVEHPKHAIDLSADDDLKAREIDLEKREGEVAKELVEKHRGHPPLGVGII